MNDMMFLIRRELWENRALYLVPGVFAIVVLLSFTVGIARGTAYVGDAHILEQMARLSPTMAGEAVGVLSFGLWMVFSMVLTAVVFFYTL
ncbi:MAG: hypothetical protein AAFU65_16780, partial [Pseudomonadota bacterium]